MASELLSFGPPDVEGIPAFMEALEQLRARLTPREWRAQVRASHELRRWKYFLALDPYTRWGLVKPRGYAGDARLMDFAYRHPEVAADVDQAGPVGAAIYAYTSQARQSASGRERLGFVRQMLASLSKESPQRVVSFASGFARELESLGASASASASASAGIAEFVAVDADESALSAASRSAGAIPHQLVCRNVVSDDTSDIGPAGLVYSLGLFDYLQADTARQVLRKMLRLTAPQGLCVVANLSHDAANLGYCEGVMDWWMVTRSADELLAMGQETAYAEGVTAHLETVQIGCFHVLTIHRGRSLLEPAGVTDLGRPTPDVRAS